LLDAARRELDALLADNPALATRLALYRRALGS